VGPRAGLDGRKIWSPPDSIPDRPARSQSPYRLSYPAHNDSVVTVKNVGLFDLYIYYRKLSAAEAVTCLKS